MNFVHGYNMITKNCINVATYIQIFHTIHKKLTKTTRVWTHINT